MKALSSLGIGLSLVSACLLLALVAEIYYLFWWKKRSTNRDIEDNYFSLFRLICSKRPPSLSSTAALDPLDISTSGNPASVSDDGLNMSSGKDHLLRTYGGGDDTMDVELSRLHGLSGPPRFLFTIKEETKEDLESEDGRSRGGRSRKGSRGKSFGDLMETPFLTPLSSPPFYTPPHAPFDGYNQNGFNPLFESSNLDSFNRLWSSPPPKFKFLKDAEEKLYKKTVMEEAFKARRSSGDVKDQAKKRIADHSHPSSSEEEDGSFITIVIGKNRDTVHQHHSSSSQVIPLHSSPSNFRILNENPVRTNAN